MSRWRLLADIGGTNVRFARALPDGEIVNHESNRVAAFADLEAALLGYLERAGVAEPCSEAAICAAGPVFDGAVQLTNAPWRIAASDIRKLAGDVPVALVNDLQAVALALPHLAGHEVNPVGDRCPFPENPERMLAVNVGTGFGAAVALRSAGGWVSAPSEAGHMRLCGLEGDDAVLRDATGSVTVEDMLSGEGILRLYRAHCERLGVTPEAASGEEVWHRAGADPAARACSGTFTRCLAAVARDLALATAAWGGVFLTGGVVQGWAPLAHGESFRKIFEAGSKMSHCLERTFSGIIARGDVALLGLARMPIRHGASGG